MSKYDISIIDVSNLFYRAAAGLDDKSTADKVSDATKRFERFIDTQAMTKEKVYLCFDPMADSFEQKNLKSFDTASSFRQGLVPTYKTDRKGKDTATFNAVVHNIYQKYCFECKFENVFVHHDIRYEADDYVKSIINDPLNAGKKFIFCSADSDWAKYLQYGDMMKTGLSTELPKNIWTAADFQAKEGRHFGFVPTESSVTFDFVFDGDQHNNVPGVFHLPDIKIMRSTAKAILSTIHENYKLSLGEMTYDILNEAGPFEDCMKCLRLSQSAKIYHKVIESVKAHLDVINPREDLQLNETICRKITLNDFTKKKIKL